jgi:5'-nucleotidase, C-terminal domain
LDTINSLPPNLEYKSASETAMELIPALRGQGAEMIIAVTHQREPNDNKLAEKTPPGLIDLILGGHDHYYAHSVINSTHILRSGTDFKQLSYIEAWHQQGGGWDFEITRRDIVSTIPPDPATVALVGKLATNMQAKLEKPIGYTASPLDGRFTTVRRQESNLGNFVCDLMRFYYSADCALMAAGTIRGDQIYPPGVLKVKDILNCFPFEDPVVVLRVKGQDLMDALENGVSQVPALEGRFPQVSNISFGFNPAASPRSRITWAKVGEEEIQLSKYYTLATRGYMARGKDGYTSLLIRSEGGEVEELVTEENGILISTILRQYFLSLKVIGKWERMGSSLHQHWATVHGQLHSDNPPKKSSPSSQHTPARTKAALAILHKTSRKPRPKFQRYGRYHHHRTRKAHSPSPSRDDSYDSHDALDSESDFDPEILTCPQDEMNYVTVNATSAAEEEQRLRLARMVIRKWMRLAGLKRDAVHCIDGVGEEFTPSWTHAIAPRLEGRIRVDNGHTTGGQLFSPKRF